MSPIIPLSIIHHHESPALTVENVHNIELKGDDMAKNHSRFLLYRKPTEDQKLVMIDHLRTALGCLRPSKRLQICSLNLVPTILEVIQSHKITDRCYFDQEMDSKPQELIHKMFQSLPALPSV